MAELMKIRYFPANQCYAVVFGDQIIEFGGNRFFSSRLQLIQILTNLGIYADSDNNLYTAQKSEGGY